MQDSNLIDVAKPSEEEFELISGLVNTYSVEDKEESLDSPAALTAWITDHVPATRSQDYSQHDLERVVSFREALRGLLRTHNGEKLDQPIIDALSASTQHVDLNADFDDNGNCRILSNHNGASTLIGQVLSIILRAQAAGTWSRMKACGADDCQWAYYDHSRNKARTWCSMDVCGNREKARGFRKRHKYQRTHEA